MDSNKPRPAYRQRATKYRRIGTLRATAALLCGGWPIAGVAQMVAPTPQPPGIPVTPEQAAEIENWAVHGQSTFTWMLQPAFHAPYTGPQSLQRDANGRETFDATLYAGFRPWPGAEIWINPEVDQGSGLSNTFGVAGYPSGEAYKVGKSEPYVLVQRGFLRQTIDLGGETEKLEPDLNQLGGTQTANRLVLTIDKYSIVDIFNTNRYAHARATTFSTGRLSTRVPSTTRPMCGATLMAALPNGTRTGGRLGPACSICRKRRTALRCPMASVRDSS